MNSKQILLLQLQLASLDGHEHTQIKAIEKMLPDHRVTVLTRQGFGLSDRLDISDLMDLFPAAGNAAGQDGFDTALKKAVEALGAGASDLLLVPSAGPHEIEMLVRFMERNAATAFPMVKLRVLGTMSSSSLIPNCWRVCAGYANPGASVFIRKRKNFRAD